MKKLAKLLAVVLTFAMVASMVVMPASAALTNAAAGGDFESGIDAATFLSPTNGADISIAMFDENGAITEDEASAVNKALKIVVKDSAKVPVGKNSNGKDYYASQMVNYKLPGKGYYYLSQRVMLLDGVDLTQGAFRSAGAYAASTHKNANCKSGEWVKMEGVVNGAANAYAYAQVPTDNTKICVDYYVDDVEIYEIGFVPVTGLAELTGAVQFYGPEALNLAPTNIEISDGTNTVKAKTCTYADGVWNINYAGLAGETEYTMTIKAFATSGAGDQCWPTTTFTTRAKTNEEIKNEILVAGRKNSATAALSYSNSSSMTTGTQASATQVDGIYTIPSGVQADVGVAFGHVNVKYKENAVYYVTCLAKDGTPDNDDAEGDKAPYFFNIANGHDCTRATTTLVEGFNTALKNDEWTRIGYIFNAGTIDCTVASHKVNDVVDPRMHIGFRFYDNGADSVQIKDFMVSEIPAFTATAAMDATEEVDLNTEITYTFSTKPVAFTAANVAITGGLGSAAVTKVSDTEYKVALTGLEKSKNYTVALANVTDLFGQVAVASTSFETIVTDLQGSKDILAYAGVDGTFTNYTGVAESGASTVTAVELDGNRVMEVTSVNDKSWADLRINTLCDKKPLDYAKYIVTYKVKLKDASKPTTVSLGVSASAIATNTRYPGNAYTYHGEALSADKWTTVVATFDLVPFTASNSSKITEALKAGEEGSEKYNAVLNPANWTDGPFHLVLNISGLSTVYIDDVQVRQLMPIKGNDTELATVVRTGDKLTVDVATTEADKTIYVIAAKYDGAKMTDIKFAKTSKAADSFEFTGIDDTYKIMIWDSAMNSLSNAVSASEF